MAFPDRQPQVFEASRGAEEGALGKGAVSGRHQGG